MNANRQPLLSRSSPSNGETTYGRFQLQGGERSHSLRGSGKVDGSVSSLMLFPLINSQLFVILNHLSCEEFGEKNFFSGSLVV